MSERQAPADAALAVMTDDPLVYEFLRLIAAQPPLPKYLAGASVGWSPAQVDQLMRDPEFRALHDGAQDLLLDSVEAAMMRRALAGHYQAAAFVLTNMRPDRWSEQRTLEVRHSGANQADKEVVKQGFIEMLRDRGDRTELIRAAREAAIDASSVEAATSKAIERRDDGADDS